MGATMEREVKLCPGPRFGRLELAGEAVAERVLHSEYFDTEDLRLAVAGVTVRRRWTDGNESAVWQLKLPRGGSDRLEIEWPGMGCGVPDEVAEAVMAHTRGRPIVAAATLRTRRSGVRVRRKGREVAEVVCDEVEVLGAEGAARRFEELEIELLDGTRKDLRRLERRLRKAGAVDADGRPKLMQAIDLRPPRRRRVKASPTAGDHLVEALRCQYAEVLERDPETRLGIDPEALHDHRVAIRRLRAYLRVGRPFLDRQWADGLRRALAPAGRSLSAVRDLDVLIEELTAEVMHLDELERPGATDVLELLHTRRENAQDAMRRELADAAYISVLNRLEIAVEDPKVTGDGSLKRAARKAHRRARRLVRSARENPSDSQLHEVRKAVKRARYAAELADGAGVSGAGRYIKRAKLVQDVLGEHQDAAVAAAMLGEVDQELHRPIAHIAASSLRDLQRGRQQASRDAFPKLWRRLDAASKVFR
jgi:CHAD domain-containing protein